MKRFTIFFAVASLALLIAAAPEVQAGDGDTDALQCIKAKDANKLLGGNADLGAALGTPGCVVKRVASICLPASVNDGDDPYGGSISAVAPGYICFKAKCPGKAPDTRTLATRFGTVEISADFQGGTKTVCVAYD